MENHRKYFTTISTGSLSPEAIKGRAFVRRIPPEKWVWWAEKCAYGKTLGGEGVYVDLTCNYVAVSNINKREGPIQHWDIDSVVPMTEEEKLWHQIVY